MGHLAFRSCRAVDVIKEYLLSYKTSSKLIWNHNIWILENEIGVVNVNLQIYLVTKEDLTVIKRKENYPS